MPWHVPEDLAHFKAVTLGCPVVMGRKTWESLPPRFRPLPGRANIVVTHRDDWSAQGAERAASVDDALALAAAGDPPWVWVIGGAELFRQVLPRAARLEVTELRAAGGGDVVATEPGDAMAPHVDPAQWRACPRRARRRLARLPLGPRVPVPPLRARLTPRPAARRRPLPRLRFASCGTQRPTRYSGAGMSRCSVPTTRDRGTRPRQGLAPEDSS